jgi:uncharacterized SAM-binding protein YcdF (DUF218 family)
MMKLLLPAPIYLTILLLFVCVYAFRHRESLSGQLRWVLVLLLVWSYVFATPGIANALITYLERGYTQAAPPAPDKQALIMVLSSGTTVLRDGHYVSQLDAPGWARTQAAIRLWQKIGGELLFVGGPAPDGNSSQAATMAEVARDAGVPAAAIKTETRSRNTHENLDFSQTALNGRGDHVWLVTSAMHMRRAMAVAHRMGLSPHPWPCDERAVQLTHWYAWVPNSGGPAMFAEALHEAVGLIVYKLKAWA